MHSLSISTVMWVDCLKTVTDYNSADEYVIDSDEIMRDGRVLCLINDNEWYITFVLFPEHMT